MFWIQRKDLRFRVVSATVYKDRMGSQFRVGPRVCRATDVREYSTTVLALNWASIGSGKILSILLSMQCASAADQHVDKTMPRISLRKPIWHESLSLSPLQDLLWALKLVGSTYFRMFGARKALRLAWKEIIFISAGMLCRCLELKCCI